MRKIKHLFTALLLLCSVAVNAHDFEIDGIYYNITSETNKAVEVTYKGNYPFDYSNEYTGGVVIPNSVRYNGNTYSVTSIGNYAFLGYSGLTSITIPNSVTSIGDWAFSGCSSLTSIEIPNSVTSIGEFAFRGCSGFTSVTIPNSVTSIGYEAFLGCSGLTSVTIPNSVTSIGETAFADCSGLTSIIVKKGNTVYDSRNNCNAIIKTSSNTLLTGCKNTVIPNSVTSIGDEAFSNCSGLTSITIPNSVTTIGYGAFYFCSGLTSIEIPNSVTSIGNNAFDGCSGLTSIIVKEGNTVYDSRNNCNAIIKTSTNKLIAGCKNTVIPTSVTSIGESAFYDCFGLTSITIPNSVTSIGNYAFDGCSGLTSITIPNSVTSIGEYAFYDCFGLTSIEIPNSVTSIGSSAFRNCSGLTSIIVKEGNTVYDSRNNCNAIIKTSTNKLIAGCKNTVIPTSVTSIGYEAFHGCKGLTSIEIPNSVTSIGDWAFSGCSGLTSIEIPNSVTSIGNEAFHGCSSLKTVTNFSNLALEKGTTANGYVAYYANMVINAPNGSIEGDFVFKVVDGVNILSEYLGNAVDLVLPDNYKNENYVIGESAFSYCSGLTSVIIPDNVTNVGNNAFDGCSNLETLYISNTIESIGAKAFANCNKILEIKIGAKIAVEASEDIFSNIVYNNACLYVSSGRKFAYEKTSPWKNFYILEMDYTGIDEVKGENSEVKTVYDLQGRKVETPTKGIYIINGKKKLVK